MENRDIPLPIYLLKVLFEQSNAQTMYLLKNFRAIFLQKVAVILCDDQGMN